ncbi:MAG: tetratricopeptide repeat protein, partial [Zetaproteobacteria bacterium]|nr:tetratricopeptide repeat protein [Flavobacteriales bacterium]
MRKISFLFFIIFSCQLFSQTNYIDSVEQSIVNLSDEKQIKTILAIPYDKIIANTTKAEKLFLTTLSEAKKINHPEFEADISNQLALIYAFLGKYDKRLTYNLQAIKIYESIENKLKAGRTYGDLGFSMYRRDIKKAKFYMQKGIKLLKEKNDFVNLNPVYDNYGIIQEVSGNTDSAIYYYNLALDLKRNQSDSIGIPFALGHLSGAYLIKKDFKKAKEYLDESYFIRKNRKDIYGIVECLALYGDFYFAQENYKEALSWFTDCYHLAIENKYLQAGQYAAEFASKSYEKIGDFVNTIKFLKIQQTLKDSMLNMTTNKVIAQLEVQFETEKKEKQLAEQEIKITKEQLRVKQGNYTLIGLGLVLVFLLILGRYI